MSKAKDKVLIPTYQMELNGFYLLLRVRMEKKGYQNINGVGEAFFKPETYQNGNSILANLCRRDLVVEQDGRILLREGLEKALDRILDSPHCMNFQNALLQKKRQILTFYYADGAYVGVLLEQKNAMLVVAEEEDALYKAFEKQLEDRAVSREFRPEHWNVLWRGEDASGENRGILQPLREARITHSGNRIQRERFNTAMVADSKQIQVIRGADSLSWKNLNRETVAARDWYGVICRELERLKAENQSKGAEGGSGEIPREKKEIPQEKSEYQKVTAAPDFPKSRVGFLFWSLKRIIMGFPRMVAGMIRRKSLALLLYPLWGVVLFLYNMYITCYYNDTFMLDRRAKLGNLSPYLMAATLQTPSSLKGLQMKWGLIDTAFLVWPLMMVLTLLFRHVILQLRQKKAGFFGDLVKIPGAVRDCMAWRDGKSKSMWVVFALVWTLGFVVMNPITVFLAAVLLLLMFAQGRSSSLVQIAFLWACAAGRKKIDAGQKPEPDSRKYRLLLLYGSVGFAIYGLVSVLLWFAADYHWWVRLAVTVLMVLFALLQIFMPGVISGKLRSRTAIIFLVCLTVMCAAAVFGSSAGVVFADDGGWSESGGTLAGLMQNAGFSIILGISLLTIGLALGWSLMGVGIALIFGAGTFAVGLTDTKAGDYVKKSARQYFFGAKEGENKTIFCTAVELLNFASGFANPTAEMEGLLLKVFQGGKLVGDVVSTIGDAASTLEDLKSFVNSSGDVGFGDLLWDALGLGLDFRGMKGDFSDFTKTLKTPGIKGKAFRQPSLRDQHQQIQDSRQNEIANMENNLRTRRQTEIDAENLRHQNKINEIQDTIQRLENGEITPPMGVDRDTYLRELNRSLGTETTINADNLSQIRDAYRKELQDGTKQIMENYSRQERELIQNTVMDFVKEHGYDTKEELDNLRDFLSTNGLGDAGGGEAAGIEIDGDVMESGETAVPGFGEDVPGSGGMPENGDMPGSVDVPGNGGLSGRVDVPGSGTMSESVDIDTVMDALGQITNLTDEELERLLDGLQRFLGSRQEGSGGGAMTP